MRIEELIKPAKEALEVASSIGETFDNVGKEILKKILGVERGLETGIIASHHHANPAFPSRIPVGNIRLGLINQALRVPVVSIILDLLSPKREEGNEGGGYYIPFGPPLLRKRTILFREPNIFYHFQVVCRGWDKKEIQEEFQNKMLGFLASRNPGKRGKIRKRINELINRLEILLTIYERGGQNYLSFYQETYNEILKLLNLNLFASSVKMVFYSEILSQFPLIIEKILQKGIKIQELTQPLFRYLDEQGREKGTVRIEEDNTIYLELEEKRKIRWDQIYELMEKKRLIPNAELAILCLQIMGLAHFGNTYGIAKTLELKLQIKDFSKVAFAENVNSIPPGKIWYYSSKGEKIERSLFPTDYLVLGREWLAAKIISCACEGRPFLFNQSLFSLGIDAP